MQNFSAANLLGVFAVVIYALSFFLPAFEIVVEGRTSVSYGYDAFVIGFLSPFSSPFFGGWRAFVPWLANPIFWVGVFLFSRSQYGCAFFAGLIAFSMATTLLLSDPESRSLMRIGYYVWLTNFGIFILAAIVGWRSVRAELRHT